MPPLSVPLAAIRQPAFLYDAGGRIAEANDRAEALAGRPLAGLTTAGVVGIFHARAPVGAPIDLAELSAARALAGEEVVDAPLVVTAADGRTVEVLATASPVRDGDTVTGALVVWQDVTGLVAAKKALSESEERFRLALRNAPTAVFHQDADLRYTWYSNPHPPFAGTDLLGRTDADLMAPEDAAPITALKAEVLAMGEARRGEVSVTVDGATMYVDLVVEPVRDADGRTVGVMGVSHDITELKRAEAALRESEERQAFLLRLSDAIRPLADAGAIQVAASRALAEHLGADRVLYGELAPDGERITVEHGYAEGVEAWTCSMQTMEFGTGFMDALRAGRTILVSDTAHDDRVPAQARAVFTAAEVRSLAAVPLAKGARLGAVLVQQSRPRQWTPAEVALVEETAERTWAAVERARAEEALRETEAELAVAGAVADERQRLFAVLEALPLSVCLLTRDHGVAFANRNFRETFGESAGRPCHEYCFGLPEPCPFCESFRVFETGEPHRWEVALPNGRIVAAYDAPFTDTDGTPMVLEMDQDITEERRMEAALREANARLEERVRERTAELEDANARLQAILDALPVGVWVADADGMVTIVNSAAATIYEGAAPLVESVEEYPTCRIWRPGTGQPVPAADYPLARALAGESVTGMVLDFERFDGTRGTQIASSTPIRDTAGAVTGGVAIGLDITALRETEQALAESERRYQTIVETASEGIVIGLPDGPYTYVNPRMSELLGYPPEELVGRSSLDLTFDEWRPEVGRAQDDLRRGEVLQGEFKFRHRDGSAIWTLYSASPIFNEHGEHVANLALHTDITEWKRAEEVLRETRDYLDSLINYANAPIIVWDPESRITRFNAAFEHLSGYAADKVIGRDLVMLFPEESREESLEKIQRTITERWQSVEIPILRPDGEVRIALWNSANIYGKDGKTLLATIAQGQDITDRKQAEAALRENAENLQRSNEDLQRFAYVASHDLQEPLRSVISFSQLLERRYRGQLGDDADEYIAFIVEGGTRMQGLILDLLAFSRVNTTRQQIARTDAEDVFAEAVRALDVSLREADGTLTHDPLPVVMADPTQLGQVFANLISNAVKFRKPDEPLRIHVGVRRADGFCEFSVSDNGIGIEPEYFDKIFVIFQRLHTKETYPGTGIGLAIVKRIIDRHGGTIRVESTPGEGSTFFFTLPAA